MLLPYNVDRPTKRLPAVTYALMGLNIFIFLMTLVVSNTNLPADRVQARTDLGRIFTENRGANTLNIGLTGREDYFNANSDADVPENVQIAALLFLKKQPDSVENYGRTQRILHVNDRVMLAPHYSTLEYFAYRPGEESPAMKILGMFGSMFLHGGFDHIMGNMLFLWIFGRALEDVLGPLLFLGIYLSSGVAATLLFHFITMTFTPQLALMPLIGASGAISGVLGLFIVRFFRTRVRIFYLSLPLILAIPGVGYAIFLALLLFFGVLYLIFGAIFGFGAIAIALTAVAFALSVFIFGRNWAWGAFRAPSVWVIGVYIVLFNLVPAMRQLLNPGEAGSGTAYWAHLGGFVCGAFYALIIGGIEDGKDEYALEDAQSALTKAETGQALEHAQKLLDKVPSNPRALEITGKALDQEGRYPEAVDYFVRAIDGYLKAGERALAAKLYDSVIHLHPDLPLPAAALASLGAQFAQQGDYNNAAALQARIVEEFPASPEAEVAYLRSGQIWWRNFGDPTTAAQIFSDFLQHYPHSAWAPQAQKSLQHATQQAAEQTRKQEETGEKPAEL